jgi:predicted transcriptional regulator of viral defense system
MILDGANMIKTYAELKTEYGHYANVKTKISRLVKEGRIIPVARGLYETDRNVDPILLANAIYGPSYVSFQTALSEYGIIPDVVQSVTSATTLKRHSREYVNVFGRYLYRDVPRSVFPYGLTDRSENGYSLFWATPEKAVCDMLYIVSPVKSIRECEYLLFEDLRFNEEVFRQLNKEELLFLSGLYRNSNHKILGKLVKEMM